MRMTDQNVTINIFQLNIGSKYVIKLGQLHELRACRCVAAQAALLPQKLGCNVRGEIRFFVWSREASVAVGMVNSLYTTSIQYTKSVIK
jgi:hypothetical protein